MDEQAKINKDTVTKFMAIDKVLENIDSKVTKVGTSNHQVLNMKMLETQVVQLVGRLTNDEGKLSGQPKGPESAKAIQTRSGKETDDPERPARARKPKPSTEAEEIAKEKVMGIVTEEPEFEMPGEDTRIPQLKPCYFRGKLDNHFEKFVEVVRRLSINMPLLDALQVPTYSRYFKDILANKYDIATLGVDHVNGERSSFKFRPRLEACNMIEVKKVPPQRCVVKEEPRKKEGLKKRKSRRRRT
jgi:hypothetical protein